MILSPITASPDLVEFVKGWESCELSAYPDGNGVPTIGWGHTRDVYLADTCTQQQADRWLDEELWDYGEALRKYMTREPTQQQFDALLSLGYNAGIDGKKGIGRAGIMKLFNAGDDSACADRFLAWNKDEVNGKLVPNKGLTKRRRAERRIYLLGDYDGRP